MTEVRFGVAIPPEGPLDELIAVAIAAERLGCHSLWVNDDRLQKDLFTVLAIAARETHTIRLGPGVVNPYTRHPALVASAAATLDELSGGRAVLGLGAGGTNHRMLGIERNAPVAALREAVSLIRGLLHGAAMTVAGGVIRADGAELDFVPPRPCIPLYIGGRGPRILELAGEVADGAIFGNVATAIGWRYALDRIAAGAERTGRDLDDVDLVAWLYLCVDDAPEAAVEAVRPMVATTLVTSRPVLHQLGLELPIDFAREMERAKWRVAREVIEPASKLLPDELVGSLALAGSPADCRRGLADLLTAVPDIAHVVIVPLPPRGVTREQLVRRFLTEVVAPLAAHTWREPATADPRGRGS